jgi:hypothetical protein
MHFTFIAASFPLPFIPSRKGRGKCTFGEVAMIWGFEKIPGKSVFHLGNPYPNGRQKAIRHSPAAGLWFDIGLDRIHPFR